MTVLWICGKVAILIKLCLFALGNGLTLLDSLMEQNVVSQTLMFFR